VSVQNLVYRYDVRKTDDGVGGEEGTFCLCEFSTLTLLDPGSLKSTWLLFRHPVVCTVFLDDDCTAKSLLRTVEALTRAGRYEPILLSRATAMFEVSHRLTLFFTGRRSFHLQDFLQYTNHLGLCTEEIGASGEGLGNAVQGFTHVTLISAAYNLSRTISYARG
jgi:hypothetical protein